MSKDKLLPVSIVFLDFINYFCNDHFKGVRKKWSIISEAADYLDISEDKLNRIINGSEGNKTGIPNTRIGNEYLFSRKALNEWVESSNEIR